VTAGPEVVFAVVVNDEEQYSVWDVAGPPPAGWTRTGFTGTRQECLEHIELVWTDQRPRRVRDGGEGS
jgi:MbtH protein